jgi:hypothetical protein
LLIKISRLFSLPTRRNFEEKWRTSTGFGLTREYFETLRRIYAQFYPETADLDLTPVEQLTKIEDVMQDVTDKVELYMPADVYVRAMKVCSTVGTFHRSGIRKGRRRL